MGVIGGRVVRTPRKERPYKVVLDHEGGSETEHPVATMRQGETLIRTRSPSPPKPELMREWTPAGEDLQLR